jgi:hypothetical protein
MTIRLVLLLCAFAGATLAHVTPPIILTSDRDAVTTLLPGARRHFVHEVRLTDEERQAIQLESGWRPEEDFYRFYIGRDEQLQDVGAVAFLTQYTIHGPVRVAVGLAPDGKIKGALVVELSEETYPWVKTAIDSGLLRSFAGRDAHAPFPRAAGGSSMSGFYSDIIAGLVLRAALVYEAGVLKRQRR